MIASLKFSPFYKSAIDSLELGGRQVLTFCYVAQSILGIKGGWAILQSDSTTTQLQQAYAGWVFGLFISFFLRHKDNLMHNTKWTKQEFYILVYHCN